MGWVATEKTRLKQTTGVAFGGCGRTGDAEVRHRQRCRHAATRRALQKALLDEEGLVHVLNGFLFLAHGNRERLDSHGTTTELLHDALQDAPVHLVEAPLVHAQ